MTSERGGRRQCNSVSIGYFMFETGNHTECDCSQFFHTLNAVRQINLCEIKPHTSENGVV